jgi:hypothetical protein
MSYTFTDACDDTAVLIDSGRGLGDGWLVAAARSDPWGGKWVTGQAGAVANWDPEREAEVAAGWLVKPLQASVDTHDSSF